MNKRHPMRPLLPGLVLLTGGVFIAFAPDHYLPMLLRAFMLPAAITFGALALIAWVRKARWTALCAAFSSLLVGAQVQTAGRTYTASGDGRPLRVLHMNVWQPNTAHDAVIDQALQSDADILCMQEVSSEWAVRLTEGLGARYPYHHIEARNNCYGMALFSRVRPDSLRTITMEGNPFIEAIIPHEGHHVRLLSVHATSPTSYTDFRRRNNQLAQLGSYLAGQGTTTMVIGDLNTVPWDRSFRRFCAGSGLRPTTPATQRTWPAMGPLALIPLDHALVTPDIIPRSLQTLHIPGSDHRGLLIELVPGGNNMPNSPALTAATSSSTAMTGIP
ncbi:MAG TPA: endonuclease/exonuclease/phosphatase family protein [Flavobacteriales bacterium]|nr:endonuclease/exonuclease/phosphatase family protein [Flavobacteriales bacterium]